MTTGTDTGAIEVALAGRLGGFALDVEFQAPMHGITALFGPSGCGKTTVLRCVAGLQRLPGEIRVGGAVWQDNATFLPPHRRPIGYVFQEASLFPHLSVRDNLRYGERRATPDRGVAAIRFDDVVALLGLDRLIDRDPVHLSGGERQRVSIGRALLSQPRLLLMDEPLSALDRNARDEILPYFEALHAELSIPILLVSHDIAEVERLADHIVLLQSGRVLASRELNAALTDPALPFSRTRDFAAVLPARVDRIEADGVAVLDLGGHALLTVAPGLSAGGPVRVRIGASDVTLSRTRPEQSSVLNTLEARVERIDPIGDAEVNVHLALPGGSDTRFAARISRRSLGILDLREDENVFAQIKGVSLLATR